MGHGHKHAEGSRSGAASGTSRGPSNRVAQPHGNAAMVQDLFTTTLPLLPMVGGLLEMGGLLGRLNPFGGAASSLSATAPDADQDLELAKSQLADRFKVVSPAEAKKKNRAPNEVTQEEFDRVSRQFSDIRRGTSDLKFGAYQDKEFKDGAMNDIAAILQTESGRRLIGGLTNNVDEKTGRVHRTTELHRSKPKDPQRASPLDPNGTPNAVRNHGDPRVAVPGADMRVDYLPGKLTEGNGQVETGAPWMPMRSDVTLFHELTHALHGTHGRQHAISQEEEELETVGFHNHDLPANNPLHGINENAYRAERAKIGQGRVGVIGGAKGADKGMQRRQGYSDIAEKPKVDLKKPKR